MKCIFCLVVLMFSTNPLAKKTEVYYCKQKNGTVVIQDRRCMITELQQVKPGKSRQLKANKRKQGNSHSPTAIKEQSISPLIPKETLSQSPSRRKTANLQNNVQSNRSPYFNFGWDRFIPPNWVMHKSNNRIYQQMLISQAQFGGPGDFKQGVKLSVYGDTMKVSRLDSFAQALQLYHQVRDNNNFQLLDSQFKTHPSYKVFNIKYQNQRQQLLLTEFYIDEKNNDLFVVTIQASEQDWQPNWVMAEKLIKQL